MESKKTDHATGHPDSPYGLPSARAIRETVESIVIAFILAFLFRTFEAEAFVIPTGSMAPTLMGMHKDVTCPECEFQYQVGASSESAEEMARHGQEPTPVVEAVCPMCGYIRTDLQKESTYSGDRILVNKFAYDLAEPERWDVIVFRYPGDAKINYIKRLVGLPNETLVVRSGDVFTGPNPEGAEPLTIARKSHRKLRAMLQDVDDNHHIPGTLHNAGYPHRWQRPDDDGSDDEDLHEVIEPITFDTRRGESIRIKQRWEAAGGQETAWIRYVPFEPSGEDWRRAVSGAPWPDNFEHSPRPIEDFYGYNTDNLRHIAERKNRNSYDPEWVGDLAIRADVSAEQAAGIVTLALEEGGFRFLCHFDFKSGEVSLDAVAHGDPGRAILVNGKGAKSTPKATGALTGAGKHELMFANCDDKLYVWIDDEPVEFDAPTEYAHLRNSKPLGSDDYPAYIGVQGFKGSIDRIRLHRDVFYIATDEDTHQGEEVRFLIGPDQFFVMGDNSPASQDSRIWTRDLPNLGHTVDRRLLIGKALYIYWPHGRDDVIPFFPFWPNFGRMQLVR